MQKTGESYTTARIHVMRERAARLGLEEEPGQTEEPVETRDPERVEAVVLKVNQQSARVRIIGEDGQVTFRSGDIDEVVPGHLATLIIQKRWTWRGDAYASGEIENPRIDVASLDLEPLPLEGGELDDVASNSEPYRRPDPYAPLWKKLTAKPRPSFEFDGIAWGELPGAQPEENPTCQAAELVEMGDPDGAREILMDTLARDLRCLDAHGHLGNLEFDLRPKQALLHYEMGIRIGELSLPAGFDGLLPWGQNFNRPFLRCLHGYGLCLWRLGRFEEAEKAFERLLSLNPNDNQGARFCWNDVRQKRGWEEMQAEEAEAQARMAAKLKRMRAKAQREGRPS